jgi:hypothetical protein
LELDIFEGENVEEQRTWTSEEVLANLESLTRLDWNRNKLPEGARELLETYEAAIPQLAVEIRRLRGELRAKQEQSRESSEEEPEGEGSDSTEGYEDLAEFARRLGLEQR